MNNIMTFKEVAEKIGVSEKTIATWVKEGKLRKVRIIGFERDEVEKFADAYAIFKPKKRHIIPQNQDVKPII
jgi:excisionase family DNA binding protein